MGARGPACLLLLLVAACSGEPPALSALEACQRQAEVSCSKAYECLEAPERELIGFPAAPEDCVAELLAACDGEPEAEFCADGEIYHPAAAAACMSQQQAASCAAILDTAAELHAPACADMCR